VEIDLSQIPRQQQQFNKSTPQPCNHKWVKINGWMSTDKGGSPIEVIIEQCMHCFAVRQREE
jgi:hypothetical protein